MLYVLCNLRDKVHKLLTITEYVQLRKENILLRFRIKKRKMGSMFDAHILLDVSKTIKYSVFQLGWKNWIYKQFFYVAISSSLSAI